MILAIDQSTECAGLALMDGTTVRAQRHWTAKRRGGDPLFDHWRELLQEAKVSANAVTRIAVGLGPGNYTGLRVSLAAARLWALPGAIPVNGVGSSLAMAVAAAATMPEAAARLPIVVVGDARRDGVWMTRYPAAVGLHSGEQPPRIVSRPDWLRQADEAPAIWISPDWERLATPAERARLPGIPLDSPAVPAPEVLGRIVRYRQQHQVPSPPLRPVYLQPPVQGA